MKLFVSKKKKQKKKRRNQDDKLIIKHGENDVRVYPKGMLVNTHLIHEE